MKFRDEDVQKALAALSRPLKAHELSVMRPMSLLRVPVPRMPNKRCTSALSMGLPSKAFFIRTQWAAAVTLKAALAAATMYTVISGILEPFKP